MPLTVRLAHEVLTSSVGLFILHTRVRTCCLPQPISWVDAWASDCASFVRFLQLLLTGNQLGVDDSSRAHVQLQLLSSVSVHCCSAPAAGSPAEVSAEVIPSSMLPKLRHMVELMLEAGYEISQQGYIQLRDKGLHQV